ncbi:MAG: hypothetical protein ACE5JB_02320 [bacterium]
MILTIVYLGLSLPYLNLPGIQYDEVYHVPPAIAILKGHLGGEPIQIDPSIIHLFGRPFPLMFNYYTGFVKTYLCLPFFAIFGFNVYTIRGTALLLGLTALVFTFLFAHKLTNNKFVAFASTLFMATDASYIFYTRTDYAVVGTMMAFKMISLFFLLKWWQYPKIKYLVIGSFVLGLGISDRASFLWILFSLMAFAILFVYKQLKQKWHSKQISGKDVAASLISFTVGASIFIAFNVATFGGTFRPVLATFGSHSTTVNNLNFFNNLFLRLQMLTDVLSGKYLFHHYFESPRYITDQWVWSGSLFSLAFTLAFFYFVGKAVFTFLKDRQVDTKEGFLILMSLSLLLWSCFTPTLFRGHQLIMLYPFIHILIALFIWQSVQYIRKKFTGGRIKVKFLLSVAPAVVALIIASNLLVIQKYYKELLKTGGLGIWSDAIYELVDYLKRHPDWTVVCMDWGFNQNILSLSDGKVRTERKYYKHNLQDEKSLFGLFQKNYIFLFHTDKFTYFERPKHIFSQAVQDQNAKVELIKSFYQRDGEKVYQLFRVYVEETKPGLNS